MYVRPWQCNSSRSFITQSRWYRFDGMYSEFGFDSNVWTRRNGRIGKCHFRLINNKLRMERKSDQTHRMQIDGVVCFVQSSPHTQHTLIYTWHMANGTRHTQTHILCHLCQAFEFIYKYCVLRLRRLRNDVHVPCVPFARQTGCSAGSPASSSPQPLMRWNGRWQSELLEQIYCIRESSVNEWTNIILY